MLSMKYKRYVGNHDKTIATVNELIEKRPKFAELLKSTKENPESGGRELLAFLITPVQRLLRYSLLFKDYLKCTPENHPDYQWAQKVLSEFDSQANAINQAVKREQNNKKLQEIERNFVNLPKDIKEMLVSDNHIFVREGFLTKICRKSNLRRYFWLFSDCLVYGSTATQGGYVYHRHFPVAKMRINPIADTDEIKNGFQVITSEKSFTVMADTREEKEFWVMDFGECINGKRNAHNEDTILTHEKAVDSTEAPVWIPDKLAPRCMICADLFNVVRRRHHCRNCGKVICGNCSSKKRIIPNLDMQKPERVCDFCFDFFELEEKKTKPSNPSTTNQEKITEEQTEDEKQQQQNSSTEDEKKKKKEKAHLSSWQPEQIQSQSSQQKADSPSSPIVPRPSLSQSVSQMSLPSQKLPQPSQQEIELGKKVNQLLNEVEELKRKIIEKDMAIKNLVSKFIKTEEEKQELRKQAQQLEQQLEQQKKQLTPTPNVTIVNPQISIHSRSKSLSPPPQFESAVEVNATTPQPNTPPSLLISSHPAQQQQQQQQMIQKTESTPVIIQRPALPTAPKPHRPTHNLTQQNLAQQAPPESPLPLRPSRRAPPPPQNRKKSSTCNSGELSTSLPTNACPVRPLPRPPGKSSSRRRTRTLF